MSNLPIASARTPQFGLCSQPSGPNPDRCVLSSASCDSQTELYVPPYDSVLLCHDPEQVEIGRCTSDLDDSRCAPSESSCGTKGPFYKNIDSTCTLLSDSETTDGSRTTFPACEDLENDSFQCVLDENDCFINEDVSYAKWVSDWGPHECRCEDVPTGVCYLPQTGITQNLTHDNSFCAVSSEDCPPTHMWMSARDFLSSSRTTYECRLCDENKTGSKKSSSYAAGACLESGASKTSFVASSFESCALESSHCSAESAGFVSAYELQQEGLSCPIEKTTNWGTCASTGDPVECTNKASSCLYNNRFEQNYSECNIYGHSKTGLPTYFSYCAPRTDNNDKDWKDIRCVWDKSECDPDTERWEEARLPNDAWFGGCTCENVYTGVCLDQTTGEYYCAVNSYGCSSPNAYVPQHAMKHLQIGLECQLCAPGTVARTSPPTGAPVAPVTPVAPTPTESLVGAQRQPTRPPITADRPTLPPIPLPTFSPNPPAPAPVHTLPTEPTKMSSESQQQELSLGAVIGMAVGAAAACAVFVIIYTLCTDSRHKQKPQLEMSRIDKDTEDPDIVIEDLNHEEEPVVPNATIT